MPPKKKARIDEDAAEESTEPAKEEPAAEDAEMKEEEKQEEAEQKDEAGESEVKAEAEDAEATDAAMKTEEEATDAAMKTEEEAAGAEAAGAEAASAEAAGAEAADAEAASAEGAGAEAASAEAASAEAASTEAAEAEAAGDEAAAAEEESLAPAKTVGIQGPKKSKEKVEKVERETDALDDDRPRITETVECLTENTTMNLLTSTVGGILMTLKEAGMQYLLAGARASVGMKAGIYLFEAKIVETLNPQEGVTNPSKAPTPRTLFRIGVGTANSSLIIGDSEENVCFDSEGVLMHKLKKTPVGVKFGTDCTIAILLNLDEKSPNANTISIFKDGIRASEPQALPDILKGKALFPIVTFKNFTVHLNFGPECHTDLPFRCRMLQDASQEDVEVVRAGTSDDGKLEVLFPVCLPDEGTFDWLDWFLSESPKPYMELSERKILEWALKSGLWRPKSYTWKSSNDRPDMNFNIPTLDDGTVKETLKMMAAVQHRNYVVMEVKGNLVKEDREAALKRFSAPHFKKVAQVMVGPPVEEFRKRTQAILLAEKQEKANAEWEKKKLEPKAMSKQAAKKKLEKAKKLAEEKAKKEEKQEEMKAEDAETKAEEEVKDEKDVKMEAKDEDDNGKANEDPDEKPPTVSLTTAEKRVYFRKLPYPDLTPQIMSSFFGKFTLPEESEGFDEVQYCWSSPEDAAEYMKRWVMERKLTTRIEDLQPSDWFREKWQEWQKDLQTWHMKHVEFKDPSKRAVASANAKAPALGSSCKAPPAQKPESLQDEKPEAKEADADKKEDLDIDDDKDPMQQLEEEMDREDMDIFGIEDVCDIGSGTPLFSNFAFEDWALLSLRFELHLLVHAFMHDANDAERMGIHPDHLAFYYNKYYKKGLNPKNYGVESVDDLIELIKDTVLIGARTKIVESQLTEDLESNEIFIKLTEEARRDRQRRIDAGEEEAALKFTRPSSFNAASPGTASSAGTSAATSTATPAEPRTPGVVRPPGAFSLGNPGTRPSFTRPQQQNWYAKGMGNMRPSQGLMARASMVPSNQYNSMRGGYNSSWKGGGWRS